MTKLISIFLVLTFLLSACGMKEFNPVYLSSKMAGNYPSGSTVCYLDGNFYVMGDDASEILVLDNELEEKGRVAVFAKGEDVRLPKASKADIEASVVIKKEQNSAVLFLGSGSLSPHRDSAFRFEAATRTVSRMSMSTFYGQLRAEFKDLNIEAAAAFDDGILLGVRANTSHPDNYFAIAATDGNSYHFTRRIKIELPVNNAGISGMDYDAGTDVLFVTFSSEETSNSYDDGKIGESYLAVLANARQMLKGETVLIKPLIKLSNLHPEFARQKIESVSVTEDDRLLLVADDDRGNTRLFTLKF